MIGNFSIFANDVLANRLVEHADRVARRNINYGTLETDLRTAAVVINDLCATVNKIDIEDPPRQEEVRQVRSQLDAANSIIASFAAAAARVHAQLVKLKNGAGSDRRIRRAIDAAIGELTR